MEVRAKTATPLYYETEEEWPEVIRKLTLIFPVIIQEQPPDIIHPQAY